MLGHPLSLLGTVDKSVCPDLINSQSEGLLSLECIQIKGSGLKVDKRLPGCFCVWNLSLDPKSNPAFVHVATVYGL